jgi:hypothetical protein
VIVHHAWEIDVIPTLAFADSSGIPPVIFVNHGDHWYWIGTSIYDTVANLRRSGRDLCERRRGIIPERNLLLPTPIERACRRWTRAEAKRRIGVPDDCLLIVSVAQGQKYRNWEPPNFIEAHSPILEAQPSARLAIVGPQAPAEWSEAIGRSGGRIHVFPETRAPGDYFDAADVYVDSFPFMSITSMLEAGSRATPVVTRRIQPSGVEILGTDAPGLDRHMVVTTELEEYVSVVLELLQQPSLRCSIGESLTENISASHTMPNWTSHLERLYEQTTSLGKLARSSEVPTTNHDETLADLFLPRIHSHTWSDLWAYAWAARRASRTTRVRTASRLCSEFGLRSTLHNVWPSASARDALRAATRLLRD